MSIDLPTSVSASSQWQLSDWAEPQMRSPAAAGGVATVEFRQLADDEMWLVDRAVSHCDSSTATLLRIYANSVAPTSLRSGSDRANFDEAEYPGGLLVRPSNFLVAQWLGCSNGAIGTLTLQVRVMRRV